MGEYFFWNFLRVTLLKSDMGGIFDLEKSLLITLDVQVKDGVYILVLFRK